MACTPSAMATEYETSSYVTTVTTITSSAEVRTPTSTITASTRICGGGGQQGAGRAKGNAAVRTQKTRTEQQAMPTRHARHLKPHALHLPGDRRRWEHGWKGFTAWAGSALSDMHQHGKGGPPQRTGLVAAEKATTTDSASTSTPTREPGDTSDDDADECTWSTYQSTSLAGPTTAWVTRTIEEAKWETTSKPVKTLYAECTVLPQESNSATSQAPFSTTIVQAEKVHANTATPSASTTTSTATGAGAVQPLAAQETDTAFTVAASSSGISPTVAAARTTTQAVPVASSADAATRPSALPSSGNAAGATSEIVIPPAQLNTASLIPAQTQISAPQANSENTSSGSPNTGAIIGGVFGGLILLGLLMCFVRAYRRHRRMQKADLMRSTWFSSGHDGHDDDGDEHGGYREKSASRLISRFSAPSIVQPEIHASSRNRLSHGVFARIAPAYVTDPLVRISHGRFPTLGTVTQKLRQSLHIGQPGGVDHGWARKFSDSSTRSPSSGGSGAPYPAAMMRSAGANNGRQHPLQQQQRIEELDSPASNTTFGPSGSRMSGADERDHPAQPVQKQARAFDSDGQRRQVQWGHSYSPSGSRDLDAIAETEGEIISFSPNGPPSGLWTNTQSYQPASERGARDSAISGRTASTTMTAAAASTSAQQRSLIPARAPQLTYEPADVGSSLFEYDVVFPVPHVSGGAAAGSAALGPGASGLATEPRTRVSAATTVTLGSDTQRETRNWYDKPYWDRQLVGLSNGSALSAGAPDQTMHGIGRGRVSFAQPPVANGYGAAQPRQSAHPYSRDHDTYEHGLAL